ncbi:MAG: TRAP transporter large permease, partial [Acetobacteraceae bacterium]
AAGGAWVQGPALYVLLASGFVLLIAIGVPVGFVLAAVGTIYILETGAAPPIAIAMTAQRGTGGFIFLALPFLILAGFIMDKGGIGGRIVAFLTALLGHLRGGLLQVMVGSMYLISGLSGSKAADVAAVGAVMRDMLNHEHISDAEGAAVLAASAAMGETVPPSIAMLVLGSITSLSIAALFIGGLLPAAVIALCLMVLIWFRARRDPVRRRWIGGRVLLRTALGAALPLGMPVMLFAGILLGIATPTEVSAFAVLYGLVLATVFYRAMGWSEFLRAVIDTAMLTGMVLFILAAAAGFSWALTVAYLPQRLVGLLQGVHNSQTIFLIGSVVLLIVVGTLLEGLPALNVLAPLLLPIAGQIGISQLHYGIILVVAMGVGAFLPPAGVGFYVCCAVMRTPIEGAARAMLPYLAVLLLGVLIVAFVPWFTLFLPHTFGFAG